MKILMRMIFDYLYKLKHLIVKYCEIINNLEEKKLEKSAHYKY